MVKVDRLGCHGLTGQINVICARPATAAAATAAIDRAEFHGEITKGDIVTIAVRIVKSFGQLHLVEEEVTVDGRKLATATLTLKVGTMP